MDWSKQSQDMFKSWSETQKKMWESFNNSMSNFQGSPDQKMWEQTLITGQKAIETTLKAQSDWAKKWVEYLEGVQNLPPHVLASAKQNLEMYNRWEETQEQLLKSWFEMLKNFDMSTFGKNWTEEGQNPFQLWQDTTKKIMDTQANWMNTWFNVYNRELKDEE